MLIVTNTMKIAEMITAIANGDPIAITMIAEKFGIDPIIAEALSAAVT